MRLAWRKVTQGLVRALLVIEDHVRRQAEHQLAHVAVAVQVNVFVLDAAPKSFNKNIIKSAPAAIHADGDTFALEHTREGVARELRALVAVEYLRRPV